MKTVSYIIIFLFVLQFTDAQNIDFIKAPRNPVGFKWKKEHFNLRGDIYSSSGKIFDRNGNLTYNYGARYYYDSNGKITGNNYDDTIEYDSRGNIVKFQYKNGGTSNYKFNNKYLLTYEKNTYGDEQTYTYDNQNRIVKTVINKKGVFYQQRDYSYSKSGDTIIIDLQYTKVDGTKGFKGTYHYLNGYLVKEILASGTYEYVNERDNQGNKIDFYSKEPNAKHYKTANRYYSDANKNYKIEFGYYIPGDKKTGKKLEYGFINGERDQSLFVSKGVKPNEKLIYDGLTKTYYSIPNVNEYIKAMDVRLPAKTILSKGETIINYAHDGKFINYVHGQYRVKAREFAFIGPHMIDYRVDKSIGRTYVIKDYKTLKKTDAVKPMRLFTADTTSILYLRELEKDNFFIVVKGKHIDYDKARFEYLTNGDPVIFIDNKPLYLLTGFKTAKDNVIYEGKTYNRELKNSSTNTTKTNIPSTPSSTSTSKKSVTKDFTCTSGDCKNGWGTLKVNDIVTDATFKNSAINGVAYITYPNGSYYHGEYKDNVRHGTGYYKWESGNVFVGEWKNGKQHGLGYTMNKDNQITTAGRFENGKLVEKQAKNYKENKVNGNCTGDCTNGFGKYSYSNGDRYWGFFKDSQRYGVGTYSWTNKSAYTGAYTADGKRNGYGIYTYVDGSVFKGLFINDSIDGLGVMKYAKTGNISQGVFNNKGAKIRDY